MNKFSKDLLRLKVKIIFYVMEKSRSYGLKEIAMPYGIRIIIEQGIAIGLKTPTIEENAMYKLLLIF